MENKSITIELPGSISADNAGALEESIKEQLGSDQYESVIMDAINTNYISSAGLRVLLKYSKRYPSLLVVNVNDAVYDIFEITGFSDIMHIRRVPKEYSVEGCEVIGRGAKGIVYRYNADSIIKVYFNSSIEDIERETKLAKKALIAGIPTAISFGVVRVGDNYGSFFELIDARTISQAILSAPDDFDKYVGIMADLVKDIHSTNVSMNDFPDFRIEGHAWINGGIAHVDEEKAKRLSDMIDAMPERHTMIHGDFHSNNVLLQQGEAILIDMDRVSYGQPVFELCGLYMCYVAFGVIDPSFVENFIGLDYETCQRFWNVFLDKYLGPVSEEQRREIEDKIALLTYARLVRRVFKGGTSLDEKKQHELEVYMDKVNSLLERVETLDF